VVHRRRNGHDSYLYRCVRQSDVGSTYRHAMSVDKLDAIVWSKIEAILQNPALIAEQLAVQATMTTDTFAEDLAAIASRDASLARQQSGYVDSLGRAIAREDESTTVMIEGKLALISKERARLAKERQTLEARQAATAQTQHQVRDLMAWCETVGRRLDVFTYGQKRLALDAFAVEVRLWRSDHVPPYEVTAGPELDCPIVGHTTR
jgi:hypothetical protein